MTTAALPAPPVVSEALPRLDHLRVLVQLGGIPLHGQERGNIQVFTALKEVGVDALFVTHRGYGHEVIQPTLDRLGHRWTVGTYPGLIGRGMGPRAWAERLGEVVQSNRDLYRTARAYRPTHLHVCNEGHFLAALPAARALRVPIVYRLGDEPRLHHPVYRALWRHAIVPSVSRFVCVSRFIRDRLLEAGAPPERVRVIYTYPQERRPLAAGERLGGSAGASGGDARLRALRAEPFEGRTFAFMGQLSEAKGVHVLVEAALRLCRERPDVRLLMAGDYTWRNPFAQALMGEVAAAGLSERIVFLGYVEDVPGLLAMADVHVCPSVWQEPLANTVVEAKRAGCPSVVTAVGGLPELVEEGEDGWVVAGGDVEALYGALRRCAELPVERLAEHRAAVRRSLVRLGITKEAFTRAWADVYASC